MFGLFRKKPAPPLLMVRVNETELCRVNEDELPCEKNPSRYLESGSMLEFVDADGAVHRHELGSDSGWYHFSIRVHDNLACQADCVITQSEQFDPEAFEAGKASAIRFQPFFLAGASVSNSALQGQGLFSRGLHYSGMITNGNVVLSCECDHCQRSFQIHSYHAGFSNAGYFYSGSGKHTLTVDSYLPGAPAALADPDPEQLAALEAQLPLAPDGSSYCYQNPFRCPHCSAPYIDFIANPGSRAAEYYGNYFVGSELLRYEPDDLKAESAALT